jgi:predicted enzyme related to lactoylglutathione lyase
MIDTRPVSDPARAVLGDATIPYLILYANDLSLSRAFYEQQLGLRVVEADENSVKYDAGLVMVCLLRADDYGVTLVGRRDDASDVVFLVDDINLARQDLEARGVVFVRRRTYEIGLVTDFYDPSGHRLMLYQPSPEALSWPSGDKLRAVWAACGRGGSGLIGPAAGSQGSEGGGHRSSGLDGKPLVYLFLFVPGSRGASAFYHATLGLRPIESVHCCNPACPPEELGVAKYDGGGMLLTTHHIHPTPVVDDFGRIYSPRETDPTHVKGIVPVFLVTDLADKVRTLARNGVVFDQGVVRSQLGQLARFEAPGGHGFLLYEPSPEALKWPSGIKVRQILTTLREAEGPARARATS